MKEADIKLSQLRALILVAEKNNFSEAALELGVSQSAVSHAIATLEEELGVVLLSRGRHGARLTPVGERITQHAKEMLNLLATINKEATMSKGLQGGQLRITSFRSVATHVLPEVIARFRNKFPGISVTIVDHRCYEEVEEALRKGQADIGFTCIPTTNDFEGWELMRDEYLLLLPPNWPHPKTPITLEEIGAYPMIMPVTGDYCSFLIREHFAKLKQSLNTIYEIQEDSTIIGMVNQGLGATIMARLAAEPLPPEIQAYSLPIPLERVIQVAILADALHSPAVFAFLDLLKEIPTLNQGSTTEKVIPYPKPTLKAL
jgi:DNA-binding transcriptional LysR family regulator